MSTKWWHAKSHHEFWLKRKVFFFYFFFYFKDVNFCLRILTSTQKNTVITTAKLQEQGHKSIFEVISLLYCVWNLTDLHSLFLFCTGIRSIRPIVPDLMTSQRL